MHIGLCLGILWPKSTSATISIVSRRHGGASQSDRLVIDLLGCTLAVRIEAALHPQPKPVTTCRPICRGLPHSGSLGQCAKITPAVRYLNKNNTILANILLVSNDVAAEFFVESASALVLSKDPEARRLQPPPLQLSTHYAHQGHSKPTALKSA